MTRTGAKMPECLFFPQAGDKISTDAVLRQQKTMRQSITSKEKKTYSNRKYAKTPNQIMKPI